MTPLGILVLLYLAFICGAGYLLWALLMKNKMCIRDRAKDEANKERLESVLYHLCEALRVAGILLNAYLPSTAPKMMEQLGLCLLYTSPLQRQSRNGLGRPLGTLERAGPAKAEVQPLLLSLIHISPKASAFIFA